MKKVMEKSEFLKRMNEICWCIEEDNKNGGEWGDIFDKLCLMLVSVVKSLVKDEYLRKVECLRKVEEFCDIVEENKDIFMRGGVMLKNEFLRKVEEFCDIVEENKKLCGGEWNDCYEGSFMGMMVILRLGIV